MKQKDEKCRVDYNGRCQISMTFLLLYVFTKMQEDINNSGSLNYSWNRNQRKRKCFWFTSFVFGQKLECQGELCAPVTNYSVSSSENNTTRDKSVCNWLPQSKGYTLFLGERGLEQKRKESKEALFNLQCLRSLGGVHYIARFWINTGVCVPYNTWAHKNGECVLIFQPPSCWISNYCQSIQFYLKLSENSKENY